MTFLNSDRDPKVFRRGYFSPEGMPAYWVEDERDPDRPTGIVYRLERHGRRDGDWRFEADGIYAMSSLGRWFKTRDAAGDALFEEIRGRYFYDGKEQTR